MSVERRSEFDDDERRARFAANAETYESGRPGYPGELFEILTLSCGLGPDCRVLEVGPGTGQATGPLLDAGADVTAVEVGTELAQRLAAKYENRNLRVIVGDFETVDLPDEPFDLVAAATSFHWVPPATGLARVAQILRPGGAIALWWNFYGKLDGPDRFHEALRPVLRRHAPQLDDDAGVGVGAHPYAVDVAARTAEFETAAPFGPVTHRFIPWTATHTAADVRLLFASFSNWMALEDQVRESLLDDVERLAVDQFDGIVQRQYVTCLYTAQRPGPYQQS